MSLPVYGVKGLQTLLFRANEWLLFGMHAFVNFQTVRRQKRFTAVDYVTLKPIFTYGNYVNKIGFQ